MYPITVDIIRTASSRPELLKKSTESLLLSIVCSYPFQHIIHEDCLFAEESEKTVSWIKKSNLFDHLIVSNPSVGQTVALNKLVTYTLADYLLSWEDDWVALRPIDINLAIKIMEENNDVNQICFHKRRTMKEKPGFVKKEVVRSGVTLVTNPHWAYLPALWRMKFVKTWWVPPEGRRSIWYYNDLLKNGEVTDADWVIKKAGTYYLGKFGEMPFVEHIGADLSTRKKYLI